MHRRTALAVAAVLLSFLVAVGAQPPPAAQVSLFSTDPAGALAAGLATDDYLVRLDADGLTLARDLLLGGSPVRMPLPVGQGVVLDVVFAELVPTGRGYSLVGHLADTAPPAGETPAEVVRLTVHGGDVAGEVVSRLGGWTLAGEVGFNGVVVSRVARPLSHPSYDVVPPPDLPVRESHRQPWVEPANEADILVVFLRSAVDELGGIGRARALADDWVQGTNTALANSGAPTRLRLVAALPARPSDPYRSESLNNSLTLLSKSIDDGGFDPQGVFDWVLDAREEYRADLVHLIVEGYRRGRGGACAVSLVGTPGWASPWLPGGEPYTVPEQGFAVIRRNCGYLVFAHEVGHNFGLNHDRYTERYAAAVRSEDYPETAYGLEDFVIPYSFGYVNQARFRRGSGSGSRDAWRTIMSYASQCVDSGFNCRELARFSSPRWSHHGDPGGISGNSPSARIDGPADAVRVLSEFSSLTTHNLRANCLRDGWKLNLQAWTGDFVRAEHGGGGRVIANRSRPLAQETFTVDADSPGCVEHGSAIALRAGDGRYLRAVDGGGGPVDARGVRPGEWERFRVERIEQQQDGLRLIGPVDDIALRSADGSYLRVRYRDERARPLRAEGSVLGPWEHFVVTVHRP